MDRYQVAPKTVYSTMLLLVSMALCVKISVLELFLNNFFLIWVDPEPAFYLSTYPDPGSLNNGDHPDPDPVQTWLSLKSLIFYMKNIHYVGNNRS